MTAFINDTAYQWTSAPAEGYELYLKGSLIWQRQSLTGKKAMDLLLSLVKGQADEADLIGSLSSLAGNFAFFYKDEERAMAMVDRKRSFPLFYSQHGHDLRISNSATRLAAEQGLSEVSPNVRLAFQMAGYTIGKSTLLKGLSQLQAGELMIAGSDKALRLVRYYVANQAEKKEQPEQSWLHDLDQVLEVVFKRLVQMINNRQVIIPLSGGYDSRLVLALLKKHGHQNIKTFTYGRPWLWEVKQAKRIADQAGVDWTYLQLERGPLLDRFHSQDRRQFFQYALGASSTPGIPEYYSIGMLKELGFLDDEAVIINGQTGDFISGGHIPDFSLAEDGKVDPNQVIDKVIDKHFALWTDLLSRGKKEVKRQLLELTDLDTEQLLDEQQAANLFEQVEWSERQSKYIVNCTRAYEWFGYDWQLPLWDDDFMFFWDSVPLPYKKGQYLLKKYMHLTDPMGLFSLEKIDYTKSYPTRLKLAKKAVGFQSLILGTDRTVAVRHYLKYFLEYGPFFPQRTYWEFLKDSKYHRNPVSYWSRYALKEMS